MEPEEGIVGASDLYSEALRRAVTYSGGTQLGHLAGAEWVW